MAELWRTVNSYFWAESFWFPGVKSWEDLKNTDNGIYHPQTSDLLCPIYLSVVLYITRRAFEWYIFQPIGHTNGLMGTVKKACSNPTLENAFKLKKVPTQETIQNLAKQTDLTVRQIERWFRIRRNQERTPVLKKFVESSWRCLFYFVIFWYGIYIHLDKEWFSNTVYVWRGWPDHHVSNDIYWYYMVEAGFYISLMMSLFTDHKRKDFKEMVVHHVATLVLMGMSWMNNFVRIGTLVLLVHDAVDSWLEAAKIAKYLGYHRTCDILFVIFAVVWVITRMVIFPFKIIRTTIFEAVNELGHYPGLLNMYGVYNALLCILQVLHIIWFYYIFLIASDALRGKVKKDSRSSLESESATDEDEIQKQKENNTNHCSGLNDINGIIKLKPDKMS